MGRCFNLLPSATKWWQGNIFTSVSQEFCGWYASTEGVSASVHAGIHTPPADTPPGQTPPPPPADGYCFFKFKLFLIQIFFLKKKFLIQIFKKKTFQQIFSPIISLKKNYFIILPAPDQGAGGTHPTGMHSCFICGRSPLDYVALGVVTWCEKVLQ